MNTRLFYVGMAAAMAVTVLVGFGPTYFARPLFQLTPLSLLAHVHGVLFVAWIVLLLAQTSLVAGRRTDLHRRLGIAGVALALAMIPAGTLLAVDSAKRGLSPGALNPLTFLAVPLGALVMFTGFFAAAFWTRRSPETHKRLMLLATISIITPAIARLWFVGQRAPGDCARTDESVRARRRRVRLEAAPQGPSGLHLGRAADSISPGAVRVTIGRTDLWHTIARAMIG